MATDVPNFPVYASDRPFEPAPRKPGAVAFVRGNEFTFDEAVEYLIDEQVRAENKAREVGDPDKVRGAYARAEACSKVLAQLKKAKPDNLADEPWDLEAKLTEVQRED